LLLETAQAIDEAQQQQQTDLRNDHVQAMANSPAPAGLPRDHEAESEEAKLYDASRIPGVEFLVATDVKKNRRAASWGLENPDQFGDWVSSSVNALREIGETCQWGELRSIEGKGLHGNVAVLVHRDTAIGAGWERSLAWSQVREGMKKILTRWIS
jgi:hypothetical protein